MRLKSQKATANALRTDRRLPRVEVIHEVEELLALQTPDHKLSRILAEKFGISESSAKNYVSAVLEAWATRPPIQREALRQKLRESLADLYARCLSEGNLNVADKVLDKIARVDGLYQPTQVEVSAGVSTPTLDPEAARERIRTLLAKHPEIGLGTPTSLKVLPPGCTEMPKIGVIEDPEGSDGGN